jgi:hypothetical protein
LVVLGAIELLSDGRETVLSELDALGEIGASCEIEDDLCRLGGIAPLRVVGVLCPSPDRAGAVRMVIDGSGRRDEAAVVEEAGAKAAGLDGRGLNPQWFELVAQTLGQALDGELGRTVDAPPGASDDPARGGDVDGPPFPLLPQAWEDRA